MKSNVSRSNSSDVKGKGQQVETAIRTCRPRGKARSSHLGKWQEPVKNAQAKGRFEPNALGRMTSHI